MLDPKMLSAAGGAGGASGIGGFMSKFSSITIKFKEFLIALAIVLAFVVLVIIVIYCFRVMYIRVLWIRRAEDLEGFMTSITADMQNTVLLYDGLIGATPAADAVDSAAAVDGADSAATDAVDSAATDAWTSEIKRLFGDTIAATGETVPGIISLIRLKTPNKSQGQGQTQGTEGNSTDPGKLVIQTDLEWYYKYRGIFTNKLDLFFYDSVFKEFKRPEFQPPPGRPKKDLNTMGREYCKERIQSIVDLKDKIAITNVQPIEKAISDAADFPKKQDFIQFFMGIRHIDMYLNVYGDTLMKMYENRRVSFFNYLISLVRPQYERFIVQEVVERWKQNLSNENETSARDLFEQRWDALRAWIFTFIKDIMSSSDDTFNENKEVGYKDIGEVSTTRG